MLSSCIRMPADDNRVAVAGSREELRYHRPWWGRAPAAVGTGIRGGCDVVWGSGFLAVLCSPFLLPLPSCSPSNKNTCCKPTFSGNAGMRKRGVFVPRLVGAAWRTCWGSEGPGAPQPRFQRRTRPFCQPRDAAGGEDLPLPPRPRGGAGACRGPAKVSRQVVRGVCLGCTGISAVLKDTVSDDRQRVEGAAVDKAVYSVFKGSWKGSAGACGCSMRTPQGQNFISVLQNLPVIVSFLLLAQESPGYF